MQAQKPAIASVYLYHDQRQIRCHHIVEEGDYQINGMYLLK